MPSLPGSSAGTSLPIGCSRDFDDFTAGLSHVQREGEKGRAAQALLTLRTRASPLPEARWAGDGSAATPGAGARGPPAGGGGGERRARAPTRRAALRHPPCTPFPSPPAAGMWTALARPWGGCAAAAFRSLGLPCPPPRVQRRAGTGRRRPGGRLGRQRWERRCRRGARELRGGSGPGRRSVSRVRAAGCSRRKVGRGKLGSALCPPPWGGEQSPCSRPDEREPAPSARLGVTSLFPSALGFFFFPL